RLQAAQRLFEVPRRLYAAAARPASPRSLVGPPRAAALIIPRHRTSCRADARSAAYIGDKRGGGKRRRAPGPDAAPVRGLPAMAPDPSYPPRPDVAGDDRGLVGAMTLASPPPAKRMPASAQAAVQAGTRCPSTETSARTIAAFAACAQAAGCGR